VADRIILINKPLRWTSFDVIKKIRKPLLEEKKKEFPVEERNRIKNYKVGHAGTLDPLAAGLLVVCTGSFTKKINEIQDAEKEYTGTLVLGATTPSFDLETAPMNFLPYDTITEDMILKAASSMCGIQMQTPPVHSAKKVEGVRAYEKARKGENFILEPRKVTIKTFEITGIRLPEIDFRVVCTKGTYIRSLANDLGMKLSTGAYLSALCRTRIGSFLLKDALTPEEFLIQLSEKQSIK
jgi:tRNA pseudouridine55 synthase